MAKIAAIAVRLPPTFPTPLFRSLAPELMQFAIGLCMKSHPAIPHRQTHRPNRVQMLARKFTRTRLLHDERLSGQLLLLLPLERVSRRVRVRVG